MDLFEYGGGTWLITVDYHSRWVEIKLLPTQTAKCVTAAAKELFATHGIPDSEPSELLMGRLRTRFPVFAKTAGTLRSEMQRL